MKAIVFDIDGTLSLVGSRLKYLYQDKPDWNAFYDACGEDKPNKAIVNLYTALYCSPYCNDHTFILLTSRTERFRQQTIAWLDNQGICYDYLVMRPDGDHRPDTEMKPELLQPFLDDGYTVDMIFDDRDSMVKKWRELGYTCLQVADGNF